MPGKVKGNMETLKLSFDAEMLGPAMTLTIEVPYSDGIVATSRFCPLELLEGDINLIAALNGESLEDFVRDCKMQLKIASEVYPQSPSIHEAFIAGLIGSVMEHKGRVGQLSMKALLLHVDAFSYLVHASCASEDQVKHMYSKVLESVSKTVQGELK